MSKRPRVRLALGWYHHEIHRGVAKYAQKAHWHLWSAQALHTKIHPNWTGDGFITNGLNPEESRILWSMSHLPTVAINLRMGRDNVGHVRTDFEATGKLAFDHFRERGFEHYAWVSRYDSHELTRAKAFQREAEAQELACEPIAFFEAFGDEAVPSKVRREWLAERVEALPKPVAILAVNDPEAVDVLEACEDLDLSVPEQVAVMGVGNAEEICRYTQVPLTSIDIGREAIGQAAAELLDRMMAGEPAPDEPVIVQPVRVVSRMSTDIIAVPHVEVARAMRFIWENAHKGISVEDVVDAVSLSRRALFSAFRRHLGRSPHQEILSRKLKTAEQLLRETEKKVSQICSESGFSSLTHLYQAFGKAHGIPPREYRLRFQAENQEA